MLGIARDIINFLIAVHIMNNINLKVIMAIFMSCLPFCTELCYKAFQAGTHSF